ncbi:MAG: LruC domain-containing protein [Deltaproteobacteria bacterium]
MNAKKIAALPFLASFAFAAPAFAFDADADGTKDAADAYPCEANAVGAGFYPAQGDHGLMMFEDLWPTNGDLDFNDAVIAYNYIYKFDAAGDVIQIRATFNIQALGAELRSGLGLSLPIPRSAVGGVRLTRWDKHKNEEGSVNLVPTNDTNLTFVISDNMREFFDYYGGGINTSPSEPRLHGETIEIWIDMWQPTPFPTSQAPYDLFIFRTDDPTHEIHRPEYSGTTNMNTALFNTGDDGSNATRSYTNIAGLPFALVFPTLVPYPSEGVTIDTLYPNITAWAASGGTTNQDFYTNGVNVSAAYTDVNGLGAPTPEFIGPADLPAQTGCIRDWGLAVEWGSVASRYSYGAVVDTSGNTTITGYTQGAFMNQTNAGGLDAFVAQYDISSGNLLWVQQLGSSGDDAGRDIARDNSGNIYVVGDTEGTFQGLTPAGGRDVWIMKLSPAGAILWTQLFGGGGDDSGNGITVDGSGNVYIAGGSTSSSLPGSASPANTPASFVAKLDTNGTRLWTNYYIPDTGHGSNMSYAMDVEISRNGGDVFVAGTERRYNLDANAAFNQYLARHDANTGATVWTRHVGGHGFRLSPIDYQYGYAFGVAVDDLDGSAYIVGDWYGGTANGMWNGWSRGTGDISPDATITKFSPTGAQLWEYPIASSDAQEDFAWGVVADGAGGAVYVTGRTLGTLPMQTNQGVTDYFVRAYSFDGTERWTRQDGSFAFDSGHIAAVQNTSETGGDVFIIGNTTSLEGWGWSQWDITLTTLDTTDGSVTNQVGANRLHWQIGPAGTCSTTCGQGTTSRTITCVLPDGSTAPDAACASLPHPGTTFPCWDFSYCTQTWQTDAWNACTTTCGTGTQTRNVYCERDDGLVMPDYDCAGEPQPAASQACTNVSSCTYSWSTGAWSACSATGCQTGSQMRAVSCVRSDGTVVADANCGGTPPASTQSCSGMCSPTNCAELRAAGNTASGNYTIDPDGAGGQPSQTVFCDMSYGGGGWTNIDFSARRIRLSGGNFIQCQTLTANDAEIYCYRPNWQGNSSLYLYHHFCNGTDRSADWLVDHVGREIGHRLSSTLGFSSVVQNYDGNSSSVNNEYCYINGSRRVWNQCGNYVPGQNGNCAVGFFRLRR